MRLVPTLSALLVASLASAVAAQVGELRVEIHQPPPDLLLSNLERSIEVEGGASVFGGVRFLDVFLVLDSSQSLRRNDPEDYRTQGAIGLVESLSAKSDIQIGVVDFDDEARLVQPLTADRSVVIGALRGLDRFGKTNLAAGIRTGLDGLDRGARTDSSRVLLLFTDGKSNAKKARQAAQEARDRGVAVHTLLLGSNEKGTRILREIAEITGASFVHVTDPSRLPEAFLNLRTTGIEHVTLSANGSAPIDTALTGGTFAARVPLEPGENRIVATATSLAGETREASVAVFVSGPLAIAIDWPAPGTLLTHQETETWVEGTATIFANLPAAPAEIPGRGVGSVVLSVNGSPPFATTLSDGRFRGRVLLREGENHIVATATSADGRTARDEVAVMVRAPGCAELQVVARREGRPALSISDRAVEIVFDASNSMWGRMNGKAKISIAKEILQEALAWLPGDLMLGLRVYGHQHSRELRNCQDSELLVPFGSHNRQHIRGAIASFRPRGQTPLAYSLEQIHEDFAGFGGERAVVLVTDGIESCSGDPVRAARDLQQSGRIPVHVIGFGLGGDGEEDLASLQSIARASGGRFLTARSAEELRDALTVTVGTPFQVRRADRVVARGTLGGDDLFRLPAGDYVVELESAPPWEVPITLASEQGTTLVMKREAGIVSHATRMRTAGYAPCRDGNPAPASADPF